MISFFLGGYDILVNWDAEYKGKVIWNGRDDCLSLCHVS